MRIKATILTFIKTIDTSHVRTFILFSSGTSSVDNPPTTGERESRVRCGHYTSRVKIPASRTRERDITHSTGLCPEKQRRVVDIRTSLPTSRYLLSASVVRFPNVASSGRRGRMRAICEARLFVSFSVYVRASCF